MIYEIGMLCKHFKGANLLEKNIYRIEDWGVSGTNINSDIVTYTGDGILEEATNLVVYSNIFQEGKMFAREYEDISSELSDEKKREFGQILKVQPLTEEEINLVNSPEFVKEKKAKVLAKFKK